MFYPLKFRPVYKDYLWGGRSLAGLGKQLPASGPVAESWEISGHPNGLSFIANGPLTGLSLPDAVSRFGRALCGRDLPETALDRFPLLVKLIDACDALSVQVHPDDAYARSIQLQDPGKSEMWYVVQAQPGAALIAGLKPGVGRDDLAGAAASGRILDLLRFVPVKAGDAVNIPAGLVHAIGAGLVICEVQQNSDATFRLYDYERRDSSGRQRPLHIGQALGAINYSLYAGQSPVLPGLIISGSPDQPEFEIRVLVLNRYFIVREIKIQGRAAFQADGGRFETLTALAGEGEIVYQDDGQTWQEAGPDRPPSQSSLPIRQGESVLIPASLGNYSIQGHLTLINSAVSQFSSDLLKLAQSVRASRPGLDAESAAQLVQSWSSLIGLDPLPDEFRWHAAGGGSGPS